MGSKIVHRIITVVLTSATFGYGPALYALADAPMTSAIVEPTHSARAARLLPGLPEKHQRDEPALRIREDAQRHRLWVLTLEHVYVYDTRKRELIRRIQLPNWSVADFMCPPDIALDREGTAFVSNNVQPRLLQIGPVNFRTKAHQLKLISARKEWEIGFGALAFGPDGSLLALTALAGSLFRIDLASETAKEIVLSEPLADACALTNSGLE